MADWSIVLPRREVERAGPLIFGSPKAPGVLSYSVHDMSTGLEHWTVAPLAAVMLTIDLEAPDRCSLPWSPVNGLRDRPLTIEQSGRSVGVTVGLSPHAAHALFGPMRELANTTVGLTDLLGHDAQLLAEQLAGLPTWPARFGLLDGYLTRRCLAGPQPADPVRAAWHLLARTGGRVRIADLADRIGWIRQHLVTRFRDQFGLGPKSAARVLRLHRAVSLMPGSPPATIAAECGYADQSHLNRDFRALTGTTPTGYTR
ncbi:AraC-like DNA-binding protein [Saccharothrix tamanrassetensis]|uniref:AraC-like DNA-binding protein n=1 Tax=Saccharothrix tamanrassetensis TaxID=1051531 RepID=A0A841CST2_9PSEU|nr:AraC family transcriptional regulator [Saccharothrix tamanrassetensis]MBB5959384.1 AraC-like DNA-binding protein [Saccharothrix tamanrassetensis]